MSNLFRLVYQCKNCNALTLAPTTDGRVAPPPEFCLTCTSAASESTRQLAYGARRSKLSGDIINGLRLDFYNKPTREWRVQCLFCLQIVVVPNNNIGKQFSCGCLKANTLKVEFFYPVLPGAGTGGPGTGGPGTGGQDVGAKVRCMCRECGLETDYLLTTGQPIICKSGCIGRAQGMLR